MIENSFRLIKDNSKERMYYWKKSWVDRVRIILNKRKIEIVKGKIHEITKNELMMDYS